MEIHRDTRTIVMHKSGYKWEDWRRAAVAQRSRQLRRAAVQEWIEKGQTVDEVNPGRHMSSSPSRAVRDQEEPDRNMVRQ